jgi:general secretion pathway protein F
MAVFEYRGLLVASGKPVKGVRDAENAKVLRAALKREGILLTEAAEGKEGNATQAKKFDPLALFRRVTLNDIATMTRQLATLVGAGIPLVEAVSALSEQTEKMELLRILTLVRDRLNEGMSFAKALEEHPKAFPTLYVSMVSAGEASGTLEQVLDRLADFMEDQARLRGKVTAALAYPVLMMLMGSGLLTVMMTVVVPKVTSIFASLDRALPWYTALLIFLSSVIGSPVTGGLVMGLITMNLVMRTRGGGFANPSARTAIRGLTVMGCVLTLLFGLWAGTASLPLYALGVLLGVVLGFALSRFLAWTRTPKGSVWRDGMYLRLPLFGQVFRLVAVARFTRTLGTLLQSGVSLLKAMEIVKNVVDNAKLKIVVDDAMIAIREGQSISVPLKRSGEFPSMAVHMIAIGEKSGQLEHMLETVAKEYDRQVETRVTAMTSLLEPLIIVLMGGGVGFITFSILMPLIQMNDFVQ